MTQVEKLIFFDDDAPSDDPIDALLNRLGGDDSKAQAGCRILRNAETGAVAAVFPSVPFYPIGSAEQRKLESDWELRALEMTRNQQSLPALSEKPAEVWGGVKIERGD